MLNGDPMTSSPVNHAPLRLLRAALPWMALALLAPLAGCVESQPPVNQVQPNVTRKTDLLGGEWYMRSTVVDTPFTTSFTFVGESGQLERVEWEIQEEFLIARRTYEAIAGSEPQGINGTTDAQGAAVAAYRIDSHFDIRRQYNPVTGEELNVIVENTTDRPWFDREYMRVDWSENVISDPNFMMLARYFNGLQAEAVAWDVDINDPTNPNRPRFERVDPEDEGSALGYMEITNKMFVRPVETEVWGMRLPSCMLAQWFSGYPEDCTSNEITVRHSFLRVDEDRDYAPLAYSGDRMDRFGYFITERPGYDPAYGLIEPARYRFANRHNLWAQSHRRAADGELMRCTVNADCDDGRGSVCDLDLGRANRWADDAGHIQGACTIAYRDREVRPVVYHVSENLPADLLPEMDLTQSEWNRAFVETVASLRENECRDHGGADCAAERDRADHQQMFFVCPSPVPEGAPAACGPAGTVARIGDLRYSLIGWVNEANSSAPTGYGPSAADPETGEIISGTAYLYGASVDMLAQYGTDILRLLNNDLTDVDLANGAAIEEWVAAQTAGDGAEHHAVDVDGRDAERLNAAMDFDWARTGDPAEFRGAAQNPADMVERMQAAFTRLRTAGTMDANGREASDVLAALRADPQLERWLLDRDTRALAGLDPDLPLSDDDLARVSPLAGMSLEQQAALDRARDQLQAVAGIDGLDFADGGMLGFARAVRRASDGQTITWAGVAYDVSSTEGGVDYNRVSEMLRHPILSFLTLHEVGHTLGLRHNFAGSSDALNYHPRYWELRDDGDMHPRAWDPPTAAEIDGRIEEYGYSTVMDYANNFVVDQSHGLGHYDVAAIKMGYGDLVEVFESVPDTDEMAWYAFIDQAGWPVPLTLAAGRGQEMSAYAYTELLGMAGGHDSLQTRRDVDFDSLAPGGVIQASNIDFPSHDAEGHVVVPYRFCSDEQRDLRPGCMLYDRGADAFESVQSIQDNYWNYYVFNSFRRGRIGFSIRGTAGRILGRYFRKLQRANQSYALNRAGIQEAFGDAPGFDEFFTAERGMGGYTLAVGSAYQMLMQVVTNPEPGRYRRIVRADGREAMSRGGTELTIDAFQGRALETTWDFDAGYYWFDQLERVGYFYDKVLAIQVLTDPTTHFIGRDTDSDIRRYQISFASTFGPSMGEFFASLMSEDWSHISPRANGEELRYPDPLQVEIGDMPGTPIDPNASFSIQLYAALFSMALIPQTYDQQYLNRSRIWLRGASEGIDVDPSRPLVEYTDPESGYTYVAASYVEGGEERGVGAQMIQRAHDLQSRVDVGDPRSEAELRSFLDNLDIVRRLTVLLGPGAQPFGR